MTEVKVPSVAESITEVTLSRWLVADGDYVELDQHLCEFETDKASQELPSPIAGKVTLVVAEGSDLKIGALICKIDETATAPAKAAKVEAPIQKETPKVEPKKVAAPTVTTQTPATSYATGVPSPAAQKIMSENAIASNQIKGTGVSGRITKEDALNAIKNRMSGGKQAFSREERVEKMSRLRKTISDRLVYAKNTTAMLTTFNEVDMTNINKIREKYKEAFKKKHEIGLGFMSFFTKACALALEKYPAVNAYIDEGSLVFHDYADISIAVSTPKGLVVPVIRNAESLTMAEIEKKVKELASKGQEGTLSVDDMTGGTFTITNGGVFGSLMSTPIINPPQSAILGMHKIQDRPMVVDGKVEVRPMMYVALSYDHRVIDGKESVGFLVLVKDYLENPHKLLLGADPIDLLLEL